MKKLIILRGVSGSGKSTKARDIVDDYDGVATVCSTDSFFVDCASGKYNFDGKKLPEAHSWNRVEFLKL